MGVYEAGETVAAQTFTVSGSVRWQTLVIPLKLLAPSDMTPQILGMRSGATNNVGTFLVGGSVTPTVKAGDMVFAFVCSQNGGTYSSSFWTFVDAASQTQNGNLLTRLVDSGLAISGNVSGSGSGRGGAWISFVVRGYDPNSPYAWLSDLETEASIDVPDNTVVRADDISASVAFIDDNSATTQTSVANDGKMELTANASSSPVRSHVHSTLMYGSLTPGTLSRAAYTSPNPASPSARGGHLIVHAAPTINLVRAALSAGAEAEAIVDTFPGALHPEPEVIDADAYMTVRVRTLRPPFVPARPLVWVRNLLGEKVNVID